MNFALLGENPDCLPLVRAIASDPDHVLAHLVFGGDLVPEILQIVPSVRVDNEWDDLTVDESLHAIIVAGGNPEVATEVATAVEQLALAGKSIIWFPRAKNDSGVIYELTLIRDDKGITLYPVFENRVNDAVQRLVKAIDNEECGAVSSLRYERELNGSIESSTFLSEIDIDEAFLQDVDTLRFLGGDFNQITAVRSGNADDGFSLATVSLVGTGCPDASWLVKPVLGSPSSRLTVTCERGQLILSTTHESTSLVKQVGDSSEDLSPNANTSDSGKKQLEKIVLACTDHSIRPSWTDCTRAFELLNATHRSIKRRRTIDLHFETTSERTVFKSQMTAIGCGLLTLTLLLLIAFLIIGAALGSPKSLESQSATAGFLIRQSDFLDNSDRLTDEAIKRLESVALQMSDDPASVLVEQENENSKSELNERRRQTVAQVLNVANVEEADDRIVVSPIIGDTARTVMGIMRLAWIAPLFLFLALQLLILVAKPAAGAPDQEEILDEVADNPPVRE